MAAKESKVDPNEPHIIIRKIKNSPPILIEEVKGSDDNFVNYHVTNDPSSRNFSPTETISSSGLSPSQSVNSHPIISSSTSLSPSMTSKSSVDRSSTSSPPNAHIESNKIYTNRIDNNHHDGFSENTESKEINTHKLIKSIDNLNDNINSLKMMKNSKSYNDHSSLSGQSSDQRVSTYSYGVPIQSPTEPNDPDLPIINDSGDGSEQEVYDEKMFNQLYGFDQIPSVDMTNLPGEDHPNGHLIPNLLMSDNQENENEMENRNDPMDSLLFDQNFSLSENFDSLGPKRMSFNENPMENSELESLLTGKPGWINGQNSVPKLFNPSSLHEKVIL